MTQTEYWENFFKTSPEESQIDNELDALIKEFKSTPAYLEYKEKERELFSKKKEAHDKYHTHLRGQRPPRQVEKKIHLSTDEERTRKREDKRKARLDRFNSYDDRLKQLILDYATLPDDTRKTFDMECSRFHHDRYNEPPAYTNPITTEEQFCLLHNILVQTCIDYINENGLDDIDEILFSVDGLWESVKAGKWVPSTDSYCSAYGYQKEHPYDNYPGRKLIAKDL